MAEKRMFAKAIIDSDAFIDMPVSARLLYYDLGMRADDDGFVNSPKKIMRMINATEDDLKLLIIKKFIIPFENGVVVIKHWKINNYIRADRYHETTYLDEKATLRIDENGAYTTGEGKPIGCKLCGVTVGVPVGIPDGIPSGIPSADADKNRIEKNSIDKNNINNIDNINNINNINNILRSTKEGKKEIKKVFSLDDKEYLLARYLSRQIAKRLNVSEKDETTLQKWAVEFERMVRLDGHDIDDIKDVLVFSQKDQFWQTVILSAGKFRKQYLSLLSKMKQAGD